MKELLKEWNEYLKEDKEIKDYADVPGLTATQEEPKVVKFTYDAKPDRYAASREWLKKASEEFFSGVKEDLEDPYGLEEIEKSPGKVKVGYRMKNKDFDEAANLAELETFNKLGDIWHTTLVSPLEKELEFNTQLLNHLDPRSQQYQDARWIVGYAQSIIDRRREEMYRGRDTINRSIETGTDTGSGFLKLKKIVEEFEEAEKKKAALGLY